MSKCIFCDIIAGKSEASFVLRDDRVVVFMDIQPINPGHMLVVPITHAAYLSDLDVDTGAHMFRVAQNLAGALRKSRLMCEGVNLFLADGEAAFQDVFHVHLHVIPRFDGDGFGLTFPEQYYRIPSRAELARAANQIRKNLTPNNIE